MEQLEREPTGAELAQALGIEVAELDSYQTQSQARQLVSLDEMTVQAQGHDAFSLVERIPDSSAVAPDRAMLFAEDRRLVLRCLSSLPKTEATIIVLHYLQNMAMRDIAALLEVTPSRVSQIHRQALVRLKQPMRRIDESSDR